MNFKYFFCMKKIIIKWNGMRWNNQKGGWMDTHRTNYDSSWWNLKCLCANQMIKF